MPDTLPTTPKATAKDGDIGEGSYAGTQQYNTETKEFMAEQGKNVQKLAKDAATALDGPEGDALRAADDEAKAHAKH